VYVRRNTLCVVRLEAKQIRGPGNPLLSRGNTLAVHVLLQSIAAFNSVIVCVIGLRTAQFGFVPANLLCIALYTSNLCSWRFKKQNSIAPAAILLDNTPHARPEEAAALFDTLTEALLLNSQAKEALATEGTGEWAVRLDEKNPEWKARLERFKKAASPPASHNVR
jgi:hypothetical protein